MGVGAKGPSIWIVSDGRAGIERQSLSLARAIHAIAPGEATTLRLQPQGWQTSLPPDLWPWPLGALPKDQREKLTAPWPDIWIASGRRSIPYSLLAKRAAGDRTLIVQTQDPRVPLRHFDLVLPPEHDAVKGRNVLALLGPPTYWSAQEIADAAARFPDLARASGRKLLVSIGGNSKTHRMTDAKVAEIDQTLRRLGSEYALWITVSRRSPDAARAKLRQTAGEIRARFWESESQDGPNPYLAFLSLCDAALVTEDSANMLADPAFFAKPIHILKLEGGNDRFDRLHAGFIAAGAARWFNGEIDVWTYQPIRESERAAQAVLELWRARSAGVEKT